MEHLFKSKYKFQRYTESSQPVFNLSFRNNPVGTKLRKLSGKLAKH